MCLYKELAVTLCQRHICIGEILCNININNSFASILKNKDNCLEKSYLKPYVL